MCLLFFREGSENLLFERFRGFFFHNGVNFRIPIKTFVAFQITKVHYYDLNLAFLGGVGVKVKMLRETFAGQNFFWTLPYPISPHVLAGTPGTTLDTSHQGKLHSGTKNTQLLSFKVKFFFFFKFKHIYKACKVNSLF